MNRPWMPLYVADYLADTAHLSTTEHGAYFLLIMHYWTKGGLPDNEEAIRRITRLTDRQWSRSCDLLRSLFLSNWRHKRIDIEIAKAIEKSRVNSANAHRRHSERTADAQRTDTHTRAYSQSQSESESKEEKKETRANALAGLWKEEDWQRFWNEYPNKIGKADARKSFNKATKKVSPEILFQGLDKYVHKTDDRPFCNPATWLNQERWTDEPAVANGHRGNGTRHRSSGDDFFAGMSSVAADLARDGEPSGDARADIPRGRFEIDG
jgi:uncharacterized protein YdaU (DUF1376 family)